jgi:hypothetical protein
MVGRIGVVGFGRAVDLGPSEKFHLGPTVGIALLAPPLCAQGLDKPDVLIGNSYVQYTLI